LGFLIHQNTDDIVAITIQMQKHYDPSGWLTQDIKRRGDREYIYKIYRYQTQSGTKTKRVPPNLVPAVRKAIDQRKPVDQVLAIIKGEPQMAIAS